MNQRRERERERERELGLCNCLLVRLSMILSPIYYPDGGALDDEHPVVNTFRPEVEMTNDLVEIG